MTVHFQDITFQAVKKMYKGMKDFTVTKEEECEVLAEQSTLKEEHPGAPNGTK